MTTILYPLTPWAIGFLFFVALYAAERMGR